MHRTALLVTFGLELATLLAWPFAALMTAFMFDAPGSENSHLTQGLALSIVAFGPVTLVSALVGLVLVPKLKRLGAATVAAALPVLAGLVGAGFLVALQLVCGGRFSCQ